MKILPISDYVAGILAHNKLVLSRAITLLESTLPEHNTLAREILEGVLSETGNSLRIGITGVPGVGKSTFIESVGQLILEEGRRIAVLAIDPSSQKSKGSILGDKTRMEALSGHADVFIRPSPAGDALGGVGRKTRESIMLCEAAGYDTIFVETVGVGQSEISVHSMVDCFLLLMLPGAGDELQGIKRGIMEMADILAINKADGEQVQLAKNAARSYKNALHLFPPNTNGWIPKVLLCSAETKTGIDEVWKALLSFENHQKVGGYFKSKRQEQALYWFRETIRQRLMGQFYNNADTAKNIATMEAAILDGKLSSFKAADAIIADYFDR